jgi:hypothetical protein
MKPLIYAAITAAVLSSVTASAALAQQAPQASPGNAWTGTEHYSAPSAEANALTPSNPVPAPRYVLQGGYVDGGKWRGQWVLQPSGTVSD